MINFSRCRQESGILSRDFKVGNITGEESELSEIMHKMKVDLSFLQETRWKGSKSSALEGDSVCSTIV